MQLFLNRNRSFPVFSEFKHRSTVYTICWGPPIISPDSESQYTSSDLSSCKKALYSCGDNAVFMHSDGLKKSSNIDLIHTKDKERRLPKRSDVAFEPSHFRFGIHFAKKNNRKDGNINLSTYYSYVRKHIK
jgi:hypothetical protein